MKIVPITLQEAGQRLDRFLMKYLYTTNRSLIYKLLRTKKIKVNGQKKDPSFVLQEGDTLSLYIYDEKIGQSRTKIKSATAQFNTKLFDIQSILYEDSNIIIINKPSGIAVHSEDNSMVDQIQQYLGKEYSTETFRPTAVHRIDKGTSGILLFAKNYQASKVYAEQFALRTTEKKYQALLSGILKSDITVTHSLKKNSSHSKKIISDPTGKSALSHIHILENYDDSTLVEVTIETGRTHQIRAHCSAIGHPIIGDRQYGRLSHNSQYSKKYALKRIFLHAAYLQIPNKDGGYRECHAPLPNNLNHVLEQLRRKR